MTRWFPSLRTSRTLGRRVERIVAVQDGPNPSFDYYLRPRLNQCTIPFDVGDLKAPPDANTDPARWDGVLLLFCRYVSSAWLDLADRHRDRLAGVALFIDDDVDALFADATVPLWYRGRLYWRHLRHRARLQDCLDLLMISNPRIAARHGLEADAIFPPFASTEDEPLSRSVGHETRIAFHATSVHRREHLWLRSAVKQALLAEPRLRAEIVCTPSLQLVWRGLPRTDLVTPSKWPDFRRSTARRGADLLLSPLLPSPANAARAPTKRIDALRLGAAMLINDPVVYRPSPEEVRLGMCVPAERSAWSEAIVALARDRERLALLRDLNRSAVEAWNADPGPSLETVFAVAGGRSV